MTYKRGDKVEFVATFEQDFAAEIPTIVATLVHETDASNTIRLFTAEGQIGPRQVGVYGYIPADALHGHYKIKVITVTQGVFQHDLADPDGDGMITVLPGEEHKFPTLVDFDPRSADE